MKAFKKKIKLALIRLETQYPRVAIVVWIFVVSLKRKPIFYMKFSMVLYSKGYTYLSRTIFDRMVESLDQKEIHQADVFGYLELSKKFNFYYEIFDKIQYNLSESAKRVPGRHSGIYEIIDLAHDSSNIKYTKKILQDNEVYRFHLPIVYGERVSQEVLEVPVPTHSLIIIENVDVLGTFVLKKNDKILNYEPAGHPKNGFVSGNWECMVQVGDNQELAFLNYTASRKKQVKEAILLSGRCTNNYYHWLIEYLPRLLTLEELGLDKEVPLVVKSDLYKQQFESLNIFKGTRDLILFEDDMELNVGKLYVPSIPTYHPDRLDIEFWQGSAISVKHLTFLREKVLKYYGLKTNQKTKSERKIYVTRPSGRSITNASEIIEYMESQGYEIIYPELLSFEEQVRTFNEASVIVGPAGAAFANAVFCSPEAVIISFLAEHNKEYCMQGNLANFSGAKYFLLTGTPEVSREMCFSEVEFLHVNYSIDLEKLKSALTDLT